MTSGSERGNAPGPFRLPALKLDQAPSLPGIYAWYAKIGLSANDWQPVVHGGQDLSVGFVKDAISDYARIHDEPAIELQGRAAYEMLWHAFLEKRHIAQVENENTSVIEDKLANQLDNPIERKLLVHMLRNATPFFASPLYVGVAIDLKDRLETHKKRYDRTWTALKQNPQDARSYQLHGKDFGVRLAGAGIPLERLECWIFPVPEDVEIADLTVDRQRKVLENAEWVVQRIFQPVMGRR